MHFKNPEILYALILLIIPILVHLFQLQRFVKIPFTNVKFLKNIEQQTRKSARIKKLLILLTRMLAFACLILAFAQPYFSDFSSDKKFATNIYLDNSFSMQAKGENGEILKSTIQKIIEQSNFLTTELSIFTNDKNLVNLDAENLKNELIKLKYSPNKLNLYSAILKLRSSIDTKSNTLNKNILISDFQNINLENTNDITNVDSSIHFLKVTPKSILNIFIDSLFISSKNTSEIKLNVLIKSTKNNSENVPVSLLNNSKLIGKATAKFNNSKNANVEFTIPNGTDFNGKISITDTNLEFDNDFYFTLSKPEKINVLAIGKSSNFLSKIYTKNEFNYTTTPLQNLNYNTIQNQDLIILNELEEFSTALITSLKEFYFNGGNLVLIPSEKTSITSYNSLLQNLNIGTIQMPISKEHKITSINYKHPIIKDVFEKRIDNFQYPKTSLHFKNNFKNSTSILKFDNNQPFITSTSSKNSNFYWVASPLNKEISDFVQSPLVVPTFYNFAKNSANFSQLYYTISPETNIAIKASLKKDAILKISDGNSEFIPLQQVLQNKVTISLENTILKSGIYTVNNKETPIKTIAFNYNRAESDLNYLDLNTLKNSNKHIKISTSVSSLFNEINNQQKINWLFKWFLAFSVLFLLIEMLLLKYFKI
ncbi:BatA domain-containing protein [Lutibacter sp. A64]|uniref:BatA domain-containing protein n=1 Tax=Lutibacter sp. A64 TaxID=2918526 RepID=UPI001F070729|nr:BatA domain-containing protein [Lutibacter sp. A64]UMB55001.1 BatA domain-containing protein [Lutibacter sp. A64]